MLILTPLHQSELTGSTLPITEFDIKLFALPPSKGLVACSRQVSMQSILVILTPTHTYMGIWDGFGRVYTTLLFQ